MHSPLLLPNILLLFFLITFAISYGFHLRARSLAQRNRLLKNQYEQYEKEYELLWKRMDISRKFRHDFRNHMKIVERLLQEPNVSSDVHSYQLHLLSYSDSIIQTEYCRHPVLAALLYDKAKQCERHHISTEIHLETLYTEPFSDIDLAVLLFNLLDNGIESCLHEEDITKRFLNLECQKGSGYLLLRLHNCKSPSQKKNSWWSTSKKNKDYHGLGLGIIRDLAAKYNGDIIIEEDDAWFKTSVWLKYHL